MAEPRNLPPVPETSSMIRDTVMVGLDWLKWFQELYGYVTNLLNKYDQRRSGVAVLVAGTKTVTNTLVKATSYIRLTPQNTGGTAGHLSVSISAGTSFTITSTSATDTRTIFYEIVEGF